MLCFDDWCVIEKSAVNGHHLKILTASNDKLQTACDLVAKSVPSHYFSLGSLAAILKRLGKSSAAKQLRIKLPEDNKSRSGDLGEILATEYINEKTKFDAPIKRLRWKDSRDMAMRGDDVIGILQVHRNQSLRFLKSEVKSRKAISKTVIKEARSALEKDGGLPSPHALSFVADRVREMGQTDLADAIYDAQLKYGIRPEQVEHLLFTFSGDSPIKHLSGDLEDYMGSIPQHAVGLCVGTHQKFIAEVYMKALENGVDP